MEEDVSDVVYRVFHRISRRVSTRSGEWKRNKVLARTKSERDRCIIPVLLTAPPQSRSPAPSSLFIPLPLRPPHRSTHNNLFEFHFIPYGYAARRPTATPAPPTSPSTFPSRANPDRIRHFFFTFLFHVSFRAFTRFSGHEKVRNSRGYNNERVYWRKAVKRILFLPDLLHFRIRDDVSLWRGRRSVPNPEISVRSGPIVAESFYEYRRVVHRVYVSFDSMRVVFQFSDEFSVVIGSIVGVACGTTGSN